MASITLTGTLLDPTGEVAVGDQIRFTHRTTTGETIQFARSILIIPPNGLYNITLEFGLIFVEYLDIKDVNYKSLGVVTVNGDTTATDLPGLLNAIVPPTDAQLLLFQGILADTEDARDIALLAAAQQTTLELIASTTTHPNSTVLTLSGHTLPGDGGGGKWKLNGVVGQTTSQSPTDLGDFLLNDGNGNQWALVFGVVLAFNGVQYLPLPFGDSGNGSYSYNDGEFNKISDPDAFQRLFADEIDMAAGDSIGGESVTFALDQRLKTFNFVGLDSVDEWVVVNSETQGVITVDLGSGFFAEMLKRPTVGTPQGNTVIDMHYGVIRGAGFLPTETGSERKYDVSIAASKGAKTITLTTNGDVSFGQPLVIDQLIVYVGDGGDFFTVVIESIASNVLTLASGLEDDISTGENVRNFWANNAHPTTTSGGFNTIADHAIRTSTNVGEITQRVKLTAFGDAVAGTIATDANDNPGSSSVSALDVTSTIGGTANGVSATITLSKSGEHEIYVRLNPLGESVSIAWTVGSFSDSRTVDDNSVTSVRLPLGSFKKDTTVFIAVTAAGANNQFYVVEEIQVLETISGKSAFDSGTHVLLGDSWIDMATNGIFDRFVEKFPRATFIESGVGGNTAAQSVARFGADVAPFNPDYVWYMTGTNDFFTGVSPESLSFSLNKLKALCSSIGAYLLVWNSSVGPSDDAAKLNLSRRYIDEALYFDELINIPVDPITSGTWDPVVEDSSGNPATQVSVRGDWVKVGTLATLFFSIVNIDTTGLVGGDTVLIKGQPFADAGGTNVITYSAIGTSAVTFGGTAMVLIRSLAQQIELWDNNTGGTGKSIIVSDLTSTSADLRGSITYRTL